MDEVSLQEDSRMGTYSVKTITAASYVEDYIEPIRTIMHKHGGDLQVFPHHVVFTFPEGTYKVELFPRIESSRYTIHFPDGYELHEVVAATTGRVYIHFSLSDLPEHIQKKYGMPVK